ncbi:MAG: hypothetical protein A3F13_08550 [Gammaproteobacteria bacterium RIFCSPHIGHO2_12_FULL_40_19]|nr:MAG: hypothetical protein A3F13_08550 [Gammaproteobacteria bacterium RIFCSPHIGHO2_12_FULL_40_19]
MQLPKTIDPIKLAKQHVQIQGDCALAALPRVEALCDQGDHQAAVDLQFDQDASRVYFIQGSVKTTLNLICQRCNMPMSYEMDISFMLSPVVSEERAKNLPDRYEPVFMRDDVISVYEMVEDEMLLALPMVSKHPDGECSVELPDYFNAN